MGRLSQRCANCATTVAASAAFCPACGAETGGVHIESLDAAREPTSAEVVLGTPTRRWIAPAVVAGVVALVAAVVAFGAGHDPPAAAPPPSTTEAPTTTIATTTTAPRPSTTTTVYSQTQAPAYPDALGTVVYESTNDGDVVRVDLGTGAVERRHLQPDRRVAGPWLLLARRGGFAAIDASFDDQAPIFGVADGADGAVVPIGHWLELENQGAVSPRVAAAAEPDEVWIWNDVGPEGLTTLKRARLDGTITAGPVTLPRYSAVIGADGPGAVAVGGPQAFYRAVIDGTDVRMEQLWPRLPLAYTDQVLLDLSCDNALACHVDVVDRATGAPHPVPGALIGSLYPSYDATLSADGRYLGHVEYPNQEGPRLVVYDLTTGVPVVDADVTSNRYGPSGPLTTAQFSPDGRWLVFVDRTGDLKLWRVDSAEAPVMYHVPGLENVSAMSVAPG